MSLGTRYDSLVILGGGLDVAGAYVVIDEVPRINDAGWDDLTITMAVRQASLTAEAVAAAWPLGTKLTGRTWWVQGIGRIQDRGGIWLVDLSCKGWAAEKPMKITGGAAAEQQSAENVVILGDGTYPRVSIHENAPTLTVSYLIEDAADAPTDLVGRALAPPFTPPAVADGFWISIADALYHWPNGWTLMDCNPDRLVGADAALVTESYKYIRAFTP